MGNQTAGKEVGYHDARLFFASCVALVATAVIFAVRGDILGDLKSHFVLTDPQLGWVIGFAFWGFTISIFIGGQLCDLLGLKAILGMAFTCHLVGILLTIFAPNWAVLAAATLILGFGNGFIEASINPLVATIYPDQKTHKLNLLHAWWPGGIVIGSVISYALTLAATGEGGSVSADLRWAGFSLWQVKMWIIVIPALIYGSIFLKLRLPPTERVQSGISTGEMYKEAFRPLFLVFLFCMLLTAATELGTNQWIGEMMKNAGIKSGILVLAWISLLMLIGRLFAGPVVHKLNPVGLVLASAAVSVLGLIAISQVKVAWQAYAASFVFAVGICYFWPTMLGITSERFPKGGALLMGLMGAAGMASAGFSQPLFGYLYKNFGVNGALMRVAILPAVLVIIFGIVYLRDRSMGGYRIEKLTVNQGQ